jgi:O-acetyl-ADP-ribose deacetylase (regulator of RNase III)
VGWRWWWCRGCSSWHHHLTLIQGDVTEQDDIDAIVNAANTSLRPVRRRIDVTGRIHRLRGSA